MFLSKGYKGFYYLYYHDETGKRKKVSTKTKLKSEANKFLLNFNSGLRKQRVNAVKKVYKISDIETPIMDYVKSNFTKSTCEKYELTFKNMKRFLKDIPLNLISLSHIEHYKAERIKEVKKVSCNIEVRTIKAIFNLCLRLNFIEKNYVSGVQTYNIPQKEKLSLHDEEVTYLLNNIEDKTLKRIVLIGLLTGCRLNEICNIQLGDINMKDRILRIRNKPNFKTKSGKARDIPISNDLYDVLQSIHKNVDNTINFYKEDEYLFTNRRKMKFNKDYISRSFKKVLRKLNMPEKFHFHCLRHTFITKLIKKGVPINYVKELAGHSQIETTMSYIHIVTDDMREAVETVVNIRDLS